jgi:hypothetical protein
MIKKQNRKGWSFDSGSGWSIYSGQGWSDYSGQWVVFLLRSQVVILGDFSTDTPEEANYRMRECVKLGIHPYPQRFTPLNNKSRQEKYVGKYWTENLVKCFRFFWLMPGIFTRYEFKDWVAHHSDLNYRLTDADWDAWYYQNNKADKGVA